MDHPKLLKSILEEVPPNMPSIPPERVILFSGGSAKLREDRRLALWRQGVTVTEDRATLLEWAEAHGPWLVEDGEEEGSQPDPPTLKRETSSGIRTLKNLRQRLIEVYLAFIMNGVLPPPPQTHPTPSFLQPQLLLACCYLLLLLFVEITSQQKDMLPR